MVWPIDCIPHHDLVVLYVVYPIMLNLSWSPHGMLEDC